MLLFTDLFKI